MKVIDCYYYALEKPRKNNTNVSYTKWCSRNTISDKFDKLNANKLKNQRLYIIRNKKLTDIELIQIKEQVMNDIDTENKNKKVKKKAVANADLTDTKSDMKVKDWEKICDVENEMKEKTNLDNKKFNEGKNLLNNVEAGNIGSDSEKLKVTCNIKCFDEVCDSEKEEKRKTNDCSNIGFNGEIVPNNVKVDSNTINDENVEVTSNVRVCDKVCNDEEKIMNKTNFGGNIGGGEKNVINNVNLSGNMKDDEETESSYNEIFLLKEEIIEELSIVENIPIADREPLMKINYSNKFRKLFIIGNKALKQICEVLNPDLAELNQLIYYTSKILQNECGIKSRIRKNIPKKNHQNLDDK